MASTSPIDGLPYTTLGYANGGKDNYHYEVVDGKVAREDPSKVDTTSFEYGAQAAVFLDQETHGGNDVFVYATGNIRIDELCIILKDVYRWFIVKRHIVILSTH